MISDRYEVRAEADGWAVYDTHTTRPLLVNGIPQLNLASAEADELAEALNFLVSVEAFDPDIDAATAARPLPQPLRAEPVLTAD